MKSDSGKTKSAWMEAVKMPETSSLLKNITCDVCIVGAGISGITTAYLLAKEGKRVVVLDAGDVGGGETGRTTAHLSDAQDDRFYNLIYLHGEKGARMAAESHRAAIEKIEEIVNEEKIDCDFDKLPGYLFALTDKEEEELNKELEAAHQVGKTDVVKLKHCPVPSLTPGGCLEFPEQAQFHPLKYLSGLVAAFQKLGGTIYTNSHVRQFEGGLVARVTTDAGYTVTANHLVVATNTPVNDWVAIHTKQAPYRTYAIAARVKKGAIEKGLYWDNADPYHYIRLTADPAATAENGEPETELVIVGGEDHKTGQEHDTHKPFERLENWMRTHLPMAKEVVYRWSGQVMEPVDYVAYIGRNPMDKDNVYIATGDSGQGMTHGTIAGILLTDLIMKRPNEWETLYNPSRVTLKATPEFLRENLNVAAQYSDLVTPGETETVTDVAPGTGKVIRRGVTKVAVYCDDKGIRHERSAICTHLGCVVNWNDVEKSWDCPCHGSRFNPYGKVITGPALKDLGEAAAE